MRREQTKDLIKDIWQLFPNWRIDDLTKTIDLWHRYLEGEEEKYMRKALDDYILEERSTFAPSVSDLMSLAKKYKPDPRFEGIGYWEKKTKDIYPFEWDSEVYRKWYTDDRQAKSFYFYLANGLDLVATGKIKETELRDLESVLKVFERKKWLMMNKG